VPVQNAGLQQVDVSVPVQTARLQSLDVFRGGVIASMILVNNNGSSDAYGPLKHAAWHGWTFTDLVFPFFLWIVGVAITFSFAKRVERGDDRGKLLVHVLKRAAIIFGIGLFLNGFPYFDLSTIRIPGVLQRIALCYLIAATIFLFTKTAGRVIWCVGLLTVYWVLMKMVPVPGCGANSFEIGCNFAKWIDGMTLWGHMYSQTKTWDPEGVISTIPAITNVLFGIFAGQVLRTQKTPAEKSSWLLFAGATLTFAGLMLSTWMPINKGLWTSSYAVFTSGLAFLVFGSCYWLVDVLHWRRYTKPFVIYGMNALMMFILSGLFARILSIIKIDGTSLRTLIWRDMFAPLASPPVASLLFSLAHVALFWLIAWWMYRRNWIVRA
jgi:predicted acyltransferase